MTTAHEEQIQQETAELITKALNKTGKSQEKDLCKFLPAEADGHMHHFTFRKIKNKQPEQFKSLINEFILTPPKPRIIDPKQRMRRNKGLALSQSDRDHILGLALKTGNTYLLAKFESKLPLARIKKELIQSIKEDRVEADLWSCYIQSVNSNKCSYVERNTQ